jgi:hypothetical protein
MKYSSPPLLKSLPTSPHFIPYIVGQKGVGLGKPFGLVDQRE